MSTRFGFLGTGNMGSALAKGLAGQDGLQLLGFDPDQDQLKALCRETGMQPKSSGQDLAADCDYLLLAVKPHLVADVLSPLASAAASKCCLLSIAAGVRTETLKGIWRKDGPVVRIMPNTPALYGQGVFALCLEDPRLQPDQKEFLERSLADLGQVHVLPESQFDAFTALIGSGPAYVLSFMEALIQAGASLGLPWKQSEAMVQALLSGTAHMAKEHPGHLAELREMVCSPGGTTLAGLSHLERMAFRGLLQDAVRAAHDRSQALS